MVGRGRRRAPALPPLWLRGARSRPNPGTLPAPWHPNTSPLGRLGMGARRRGREASAWVLLRGKGWDVDTVPPKRGVPSVTDMSHILLLMGSGVTPALGWGWGGDSNTQPEQGCLLSLFILWDRVTQTRSEELGAGDLRAESLWLSNLCILAGGP